MEKAPRHNIEDDMSETWVEDWAGAGVAEIEEYLGKHAAFLTFLDSQETANGTALANQESAEVDFPEAT
jgi:hypothetical protein